MYSIHQELLNFTDSYLNRYGPITIPIIFNADMEYDVYLFYKQKHTYNQHPNMVETHLRMGSRPWVPVCA